MITPEQIEKKALKAFHSFLQARLIGEPFFPLEYPVGKLPMQDYEVLDASTKVLIAGSKDKRGTGYVIDFQTQHTKNYGEQRLPRKVIIETEEDYLALIKRKAKFQRFQEDAGRIRAAFPVLEAWLWQHPFTVIKYAGEWDDLLRVCRFFVDHPRPELYMRELPLPLHTKFVEQHTRILRSLLDILLPLEQINAVETHFARRFGLRYDEPLVRLRLLDSACQAVLNLPFHDMSVPVSELASWSPLTRHCLVVENKLTFLTLPKLSDTLALWGGGFRVELLRHLLWLETCSLFYWGDLDAQGFQILATLRRHFPQTVSILMDTQTLDAFRAFAVKGNPTVITDLRLLTVAEYTLYQHLQTENLRLEQEHIPTSYAVAYLRKRIEKTLE